MAGVYASVVSGEVSCAAAAANTVVLVRAATNHPIKIRGYSIFFKGTTSTNEPATVTVSRATTNGTMTITNPTEHSGTGTTLQANGWSGATANPTAGNVLERKAIHPQGAYEVIIPLGQEIFVPGGEGLMVQVTADDAVTAIGEIKYEE